MPQFPLNLSNLFQRSIWLRTGSTLQGSPCAVLCRTFVPQVMTASKLKWLWLAMAAVSAVAAANPGLEPIQWIQTIQQAAQRLNYSGTFVYLQQGGQAQTSKITHVYEGGFERERLEMLEGPPVVVVRVNEEVRTYLPEAKTVMVEKRPARSCGTLSSSVPTRVVSRRL